jgi:hypothetical protein
MSACHLHLVVVEAMGDRHLAEAVQDADISQAVEAMQVVLVVDFRTVCSMNDLPCPDLTRSYM